MTTTPYVPRLKPLIPVGHECWVAVSRTPRDEKFTQLSDQSDDFQIEWLLRAITSPGADAAQRRYDLESLAAIVTRNPKAGYGVAPIDSDTHGPECIFCALAGVDQEAIFDGHPYTDLAFCDSHEGMHPWEQCIGRRHPDNDEIKEYLTSCPT